MQFDFTKHDTNIAKGIAILAMLFHHTYPNSSFALPDFCSTSWVSILAAASKVCVALFTFLSGYGLTVSYMRRGYVGGSGLRFAISHYVKLLSIYIPIHIFAVVCLLANGHTFGELFLPGGNMVASLLREVADILCLGWLLQIRVLMGNWFVSAIVVFYFLFPLLFWLVRKLKWSVLLIAYLPWVCYLVFKIGPYKTDNALFYLFPFVAGIYFADAGLLIKLCKMRCVRYLSVISCCGFLLALALRVFCRLPADPLFALSIIGIEIFILSRLPILGAFLEFCGKHSANCWLVHLTVLTQVMSIWKNNQNYFFWFLVFLCVNCGISVVVEKTKASLKYDVFVENIRRRLK